jgi:RNA polymerase sigma-70 factor, ECF subfamily
MTDPDLDGRTAVHGADSSSSVTVHLPVLQRVAERILGCRELARDAVQEALITYWRARPAEGYERAWLLRTVIHRSLHELRTQRRRRRRESDAADDLAPGCPLCQPDGELERRELASLIDGALRSLPETYRTVFVLRELHGLDYEAIARHLQLPIGTVRSRLNRARCALRVSLRRGLAGDAAG